MKSVSGVMPPFALHTIFDGTFIAIVQQRRETETFCILDSCFFVWLCTTKGMVRWLYSQQCRGFKFLFNSLFHSSFCCCSLRWITLDSVDGALCDKKRFPEEAIFTSATFWSADSLFAIDYSTNPAPVQERAFEEVFWLIYWGMKNEHKSDFFPTRLNFSFFALLWRTNFPNYSACYIRDPPDRDAWRVDFRHSVYEKSWKSAGPTPLHQTTTACACRAQRGEKNPDTRKASRAREHNNERGRNGKRKNRCQ